MIYVTHDQVEAMTLADRIVVMNGGRVEQVGTPLELYRRVADNLFVAGFIAHPHDEFPAGDCLARSAGRQRSRRERNRSQLSADVTGNATLGDQTREPVGHRRRGVRHGDASTRGAPRGASADPRRHDRWDGGLVLKLPGSAYPAVTALHFTFDPRHAHLFGADGLRVATPHEGTLEHA